MALLMCRVANYSAIPSKDYDDDIHTSIRGSRRMAEAMHNTLFRHYGERAVADVIHCCGFPGQYSLLIGCFLRHSNGQPWGVRLLL